MPIYEYVCKACGHQLEAFQKITEQPLTECPNCHKNTLNKLISSTSFQLKGTGWYVTDFRDKDKPKKATEKKDTDSEGGKAESATTEKKTTETKSESRSETKTKDSNSGKD